uniref:Integrase catalytic domain-containing protein n=1 Tax=Lactuca sativa TaxID=4236 RepID=A0A9R1VR75_LACSA|nr:hypothetical protein LSAT_V11C400226980 [Lactuca sativa]
MNLHLNAINEDIWKCVEGTYVTPENMATLATNQATQTDIIRKLELQAKKELVSGIPHNILSQMDDIMIIIGNKRTSVLNEFDNFKMLSSETIHDTHDRFNLIMVKMNNFGIKKTQHEINLKFLNNLFESWKMGNPAIHTESLYNLYGELQSYESLINPPTTAAFGGPLALVSTTSQNQTPFIDQNFNHFNQTTSFQNQTFQSDSNDEADYQQLCALVANTNLQRFIPNHGQSNFRPNFQPRPSFGQNNSSFQPRPSFGQNNSGFQPRPYFGQNSQRPSFQNNSNQGFLNHGFQNDPNSGHNHNPNNSFQNQNRCFRNQGYNNQNNGFQNNQNFGFQQNHSQPSQQAQTQAPERHPIKSQKDDSDEDYAQRADELKKLENQEKIKTLMAIHEPSVEYWPTSDDEADNEQAQSNFCFVAGVEIPSRAPNVIEQVWSMISELGFSKTIFESHITKIETSLETDLKTYHDTMVNYDICKSELQTLQLKFGESTRTKSKLERDVERKPEDYNHVLEQLNQSLIQKRDLELKNQSIISSETKDVLEMEILQLKQDFQESTDKYNILNEKLTDSLKQINSLKTENKRLIWNMDSIKVARKLSDDIFTKANTLGTDKIDTNYRPGIGRESFAIKQAKEENMTHCENSASTLPDLFTSVNEEDSDDETVINCSPDDNAFSVSKKSFKRVVNSETNSASSLTHQIKHTDGTTKLKNFLNGENSSYEDGSTSIPTVFPTLTSSIVGKTSLGQKYSKKQQTSKKSIQVTKTPLIMPNIFENQPKKPVKPYVIPHKQVLNAGEPNDDTWYIDSGYSKHMTGNRNYLRDFKPIQTNQDVTFGNNMKAKIKGYGNITNGNFTIKKVAFVDDLKHNLISVSQLCDNILEVLFTKQRSLIMDTKTKDVIVDSDRAGNMYPLDMDLIYGKPDICLLSKAPADISWLWHRRLSHLNFGISEASVSEPLELLHIDLCGPAKTQTIQGKKYILVVVDGFSCFTWVFFLRLKSEAPKEMINFIKQIELKLKRPVRRIRSDNGLEFKNNTLDSFLKDKGIEHNFSAPSTPQQNGVVERRNRTLCEAARSMLIFADLPQYFWAEAIDTTRDKSQTTSFQNQTFQSDSNDEVDYQQLCALVANTNLQRFIPNHDQIFNQDHLLDKITQVFNQDHLLDKTTQVFNLDLTLDKILKDLLSKITQTKVFLTMDFKTIPTQVIITIQTTVFKIKTDVSEIKVTTIKTMVFKTTKILDSNKTILNLPNKPKLKHLKDIRLRVKRMTYAQRADELKKLENQEKKKTLMAIHEPSVEYWPTSDDEADNEQAQSNFCFVAGVEIPSRAPNVIEQVWSMISELGFSKTIFETHITKIETSLETDLKTYHDTMDLELKNQSIISCETKDVLEMEILQLKQDFQESTDKYNILNEKLTDSLKQINSLKTENKRLIWNMDSIKVARKLSDDIFTKANTLGTDKIDTNYRPGIGRESFEIKQAKEENKTHCENSASTLPDLFTSVNEEDSDDETVINCSPDDNAFSVSKKSFKRVVNSETNSASSLTHQIKHTDGTTKLKNFLNGENSSYEDGSTSIPTVFPTMTSSIVGKTSLGQKYSKKQQTSKKSIQVTKTPLIMPNIFENQPKKPVKPYVIPHKQVLNAGEPNDDTWYIDSGYSKHMTGNRNYLRDFKPIQTNQDVTFGNNMKAKIKGYGNITNGNFTIKKVAFVDDLKHNLISVSQLCDNILEVLFTKQRSLIMDTKTKDVIVDSDRAGNMYPLDMDLIYGKPDICLLSKAPADISWLWHRRLSHLNFGISEASVSEPLELLHIDLCGPAKTQTIQGKKYILVVVDGFSCFTWVFFLRLKSEAPKEMINFIKQIELKLKRPVRRIRSDNGLEFKNNTLDSFLKDKGIEHNFSALSTPQQNGVVERRNRTLCEAARSMLIFADLPQYFWAEAIDTTRDKSQVFKQSFRKLENG